MMSTKMLIVSILVLLLLGCNNGKSKGNLYVSDVVLKTAKTMKHKDQFTVEYTLNAINITEQDVNIDFYLIDTSSTPADVGNISVDLNNAHFVMSTTIKKVSSGTYQRSIDIMVPDIDGVVGDYIVVAIVDPNHEIEETNENDNWPTLEMINSMSDVEQASMKISAYSSNTMLVTAPAAEDIIIDGYDIGQTAIIFDIPAKRTESVLTSDLIGYIEARYGGLVMPDTVLQADVFISGTWQPLYFWNTNPLSGEDEYKTNLPFLFDQTDNEAHLGFDIAFNNDDITTLHDGYNSAIQNQLTIRFNLMPAPNSGFEDSNTDNNIVNVTLPYYFFDDAPAPSLLPSSSSPKSSLAPSQLSNAEAAITVIAFNKSYNKTYGNKSKIAAEIELEGGISVDILRVGGSAYASGRFNAHIF